MKTLDTLNPKGKIILVRTDYNVPIKDGAVDGDLRLRASFPTIEYLKKKGAKKIILISHLGRPEGTRKPELSLKPVAKRLAELLEGTPVNFVDDVSGPDVESAVASLKPGAILLLENLRFFPGEEKNSESFAEEIVDSIHPDAFVQDGFAVIHRAHASTDAITRLVPSYAGLLVESEVEKLSAVKNNPKKPLVILIGGAKVDDKQPLIDKFKTVADKILVGGKIAADGFSSIDKNVLVAEDFDEDAEGAKLDIGPKSTADFVGALKSAKTVIWNGTMGKVEDSAFSTASEIICRVLGENPDINSVICGGDTTSFVESEQKKHPELNFSLVSTGGGAALEFLVKPTLPGLAALEEA
ncbi:phosphoglycerate kinase [Candidatus Saccharibacteria bacterium]|nr:phosphoglycerate kinase [Candidatus Saccharibacteria bacterium]